MFEWMGDSEVRNIQFRVWDRILMKYYYDKYLENGEQYLISPTGEITFSEYGSYLPDDFSIEQCTGVRDKNGTPIFEGDILDMGLDGNHAVVWDVAMAGFAASVWAGQKFTKCTIAGNIHENRGLLG